MRKRPNSNASQFETLLVRSRTTKKDHKLKIKIIIKKRIKKNLKLYLINQRSSSLNVGN